MRTNINFNKLITKLIPHYLGGAKFIGFMQSLAAPLQTLNTTFKEWALETKIAANMSSQVIMLKWYLDRQMKPYINTPTAKFEITQYIKDLDEDAVTLIANNRTINTQFKVSSNGGSSVSSIYEWKEDEMYSFIVYAPYPNTTLSSSEYIQQITNIVSRYRLAGKSFKVVLK